MINEQENPDPQRVKRFAELCGIELERFKTPDCITEVIWMHKSGTDVFGFVFSPLTDLNDAFAGLEGFCNRTGFNYTLDKTVSKYRGVSIIGELEVSVARCAEKVTDSDTKNAVEALCRAIVGAVLEAGGEKQ